MDKITFIPEAELEDRRVYALRCRNLNFGVWNAADGSFYGVRQKFGDRFIDNEYQWRDRDGSAHATEALDIWLPEDIPIRAHLYLACRHCGAKTEGIVVEDEDFKARNINGGMKRIGDKHIDPADAEKCEVGDGDYLSWWVSNKDLYMFMEKVEEENDGPRNRAV